MELNTDDDLYCVYHVANDAFLKLYGIDYEWHCSSIMTGCFFTEWYIKEAMVSECDLIHFNILKDLVVSPVTFQLVENAIRKVDVDFVYSVNWEGFING